VQGNAWPGRLSRFGGAALAAILAASVSGAAPGAGGTPPPVTYGSLAARAVTTLERVYYRGAGRWSLCVPRICRPGNIDWGADSLTYNLYLHWLLTGDAQVRGIMNALTGTAPSRHAGWSDVPMWDSIAASREYQVTGNPAALVKARNAFASVAVRRLGEFALGACPGVLYQEPHGGATKVKTLETGSNYVKAALLLYQITRNRAYLRQARTQYAAIRKYFLDRKVPLYTVYVFDNGKTCTQVPRQFFGSVNGNMIWAGYFLARATGQRGYLRDALATARAVAAHLGDATGVYADLQAENDVTEPLVEAMYDLAAAGHQAFARHWLLTAANAAAANVSAGGSYGRFFDGPPPAGTSTAWQVNGGLALAQTAGSLDPSGQPAEPRFWAGASFVRDNLRLRRAPVQFTFTGRAVAIIGEIGEQCCGSGHAQVFIDGAQTFDRTGIWQNKSSSGRRMPGSVLLAWRWPEPGTHTIQIRPGTPNAKQGGSFFHMTGYLLVR